MVDVNPFLGYLQLRGDPNDKDANVDEAQDNGCTPANLGCISSVDHEEGDSVDDDPADALNLYNPEANCCGLSAEFRSSGRREGLFARNVK
jgi:hypothetical protein